MQSRTVSPARNVPTAAKAEPRILDATHRCDSCGARAYAKADIAIPGGGISELLFCGHHFKQFRERLELVSKSVVDETEFILERKARSAAFV